MKDTIKCIRNGHVVSVPKVVRVGPKGTVRTLISSLLLLFTVSCFGQLPTFKTAPEYLLPTSEWKKDLRMPDSMKLLIGNDGHTVEILSYNLNENRAALSYYGAAVLMDFADQVNEEYNQQTGVMALHFYVLQANDCAVKGAIWSNRLSIYMRPYDNLWLITYDSPCDGITIRTGDVNLQKAMKYKPPTTKTATRKYKNYVSKS